MRSVAVVAGILATTAKQDRKIFAEKKILKKSPFFRAWKNTQKVTQINHHSHIQIQTMYFTEISNNNIPAVDEQLLVTSLDLSLRLKAAGVRRYAHKMWACKKINPVQHTLCNTLGTPARSFGVSYQERSALAYNSMELDAIVKGQGYVWMDDDETYVAFAHSDYKGAGIGIVGSGYISEAEAKGELALFILAREAKKKELERPPL